MKSSLAVIDAIIMVCIGFLLTVLTAVATVIFGFWGLAVSATAGFIAMLTILRVLSKDYKQ